MLNPALDDQSKPLRAVIVARVSSDHQEENTSLEGQLNVCYQEATKRNATVHAVYTEVISGALYLARPEMQQALRDIESGLARYLIVANIDRAGRDVDALRDIRKRVHRAGGEMIFANGLQFEQSPEGNLLFTYMSGFAEYERAKIRERTVNGQLATARAGIMPSRTHAPFGYRFVSKADVEQGTHTKADIGTYLIVEEDAQWIRRMYHWCDEGVSCNEIARRLSQAGLQTKRHATRWCATTVTRMLANSAYYGRPGYGKMKGITDESRLQHGLGIKYRVARPENEVIYLSAPPIVDEALWRRVSEQKVRNKTLRAGRPDRRKLLTSLLVCAGCRRRMNMHRKHTPVKARWSRAKAKLSSITANEPYTYYSCPSHHQSGGWEIQVGRDQESNMRGDIEKPCSLAVQAPVFNDLVKRCLMEICRRPEVLRHAAEAYHRQTQNDQIQQVDIAKLQRTVEELSRKSVVTVEKQLEASLEGLDDAPYRTILARIDVQSKSLQAQIDAAISAGEPDRVLEESDVLAQAIANLGRVLDAPATMIDEHEKNLLLMQVVLTVVPLNHTSARVVLVSPFAGQHFMCDVTQTDVTVRLAGPDEDVPMPQRALPIHLKVANKF